MIDARTPPLAGRHAFAAGIALAALGSVFFSAKAIVVKLAYRHGVDATTLIAFRMLFAAPFFAVAYLWAGRGRPPLTRIYHLHLAAIGVVGYYAASYLDFLGLKYVTAGLERLILYLHPTIVLLISVLFLRKPLGWGDVAALVLAYGGIVAVYWHDVSFAGTDTGLGAALVFGAAVCYSLYLVWAGELVGRLGAVRLTSYAMLVSTAAVSAQFFVLNPVAALVQPSPVYWLSAVNGLFCTVLPVIATMLAVERIGAQRTSTVSIAGPIATIALAWVFLDEAMSLWQLAGTALVLAGIFVLSSRGGARAIGPR